MNKLIFKRAVRKFGTQTALAVHLGIDRQYLSAIKTGKQKPQKWIDAITKLAESD